MTPTHFIIFSHLDAIQKVSNAKIVNLKGDHNFNGENRTKLLVVISNMLQIYI